MTSIILAELDPLDPAAPFGECDLCEHRHLADFMNHDDHAVRPMYRVGFATQLPEPGELRCALP